MMRCFRNKSSICFMKNWIKNQWKAPGCAGGFFHVICFDCLEKHHPESAVSEEGDVSFHAENGAKSGILSCFNAFYGV